MSDIITDAVETMNRKIAGRSFDYKVRFELPGEGVFVVDESGARIADEPGDVTLKAKPKVFAAIADGSQNPASAVMLGKLKISGDMSLALKVGALFG